MKKKCMLHLKQAITIFKHVCSIDFGEIVTMYLDNESQNIDLRIYLSRILPPQANSFRISSPFLRISRQQVLQHAACWNEDMTSNGRSTIMILASLLMDSVRRTRTGRKCETLTMSSIFLDIPSDNKERK